MKILILVSIMICIGPLHRGTALENALSTLFQILPHCIVYHLHTEPLLSKCLLLKLKNTIQEALRDEN